MSLNRQRYRYALAVVLSAASVLAQSTGWDELVRKGEQAIAKGQYAPASEYLSAALDELQRIPESDRRWATTFNMLGTAKHYLGDFEVAATFFQKVSESGRNFQARSKVSPPSSTISGKHNVNRQSTAMRSSL